MDNQGKLPPLPPSDADSLRRNYYDRFYGVGSREFWGKNEVESIELKPMEKCKHYFIMKDNNYICKHCNFGLQASQGLSSSNGQLFYKNEPIPFGV